MLNQSNALDFSIPVAQNSNLPSPLDLNQTLQLSSSSLPSPQVPLGAAPIQSILDTNKGWWIVPDFNGDKNRDIFWRNKENGENKAWLFSGVNNNFTEISLSTLSQDWNFQIADFNSDGKSDFFWRNSTTGENQVWIADTNGNTFTQTNLPLTDKNWYVDIGDFNGDDNNDLMWRNYKTGENAIWLMNGSIFTAGYIYKLEDLNWDLKIGYANDDKKTDLYWYKRDTGEVAIWLMNGSVTGNGFNNGDTKTIYTLPDLNWRFELGDTNGDGKSDLVWRNYKTGENAVWLIDGLNISQSDFIYKLEDLNWDYDLADTNGDGKTDLIWRNYKTGENAVWFVNGIVFGLSDGKTIDSISGTSWDFVVTDANGNGKTDLVWRNYETGENQLWFMDGNQATKLSLSNLDKAWIFN